MPCIPLPKVPKPQLPTGLSLRPPPFPTPAIGLNACCIIINYSTDEIIGLVADQIPPIPPILLNPAVAKVLDKVISTVNKYIDKIQPDCPRE